MTKTNTPPFHPIMGKNYSTYDTDRSTDDMADSNSQIRIVVYYSAFALMYLFLLSL